MVPETGCCEKPTAEDMKLIGGFLQVQGTSYEESGMKIMNVQPIRSKVD